MADQTCERRPAGAASEAAKPGASLPFTTRLRVDLANCEHDARGTATERGVRQARSALDEALNAPDDMSVVLDVGRLRPVLIDEWWLADLLARYHVEVIADSPMLAAEWTYRLSGIAQVIA